MSAQRGIPSPHPLIADTWYVRGEKRPFEVIHDRGGSWNTMADPLQPAADWAPVVDPTQPADLLSIGNKGPVTHSRDGGASWRRLIESSVVLDIRMHAVQFVT